MHNRCSAGAQFAVFFADGAGLGIEVVQVLDAAHAQDIIGVQHFPVITDPGLLRRERRPAVAFREVLRPVRPLPAPIPAGLSFRRPSWGNGG